MGSQYILIYSNWVWYVCIHRYVIIDRFFLYFNISIASARLHYKHASLVDKLLMVKHFHSRVQSLVWKKIEIKLQHLAHEQRNP